jgi:predicted phage terminase large subunit-like protein
MVEIRPQPKQEMFLSSPADVVIYGGAAGGGKSWSLLAEPLRHIDKSNFGGVIFRRDRQQVTNEGGLWDESNDMYAPFGAISNETNLFWTFKSGAAIGFAGVQHEKDVQKWQGSQIAYLGFDELTHFTEHQFFYLLSRNRSKSAVKSYVRATCNPDADSWVAGFISWWINPATGFPIPERSGIIRYLVRNNDNNYWFDDRADGEAYAAATFPEMVDKFGASFFCKSVTFISADVFDNQILLANDPGYLANLLALPLIERERLLSGNWKIRASAGKVYNREWFEIVDTVGYGGVDVRFWDLAATEEKLKTNSRKTDPDYTATIKLRYFAKTGLWIITDAFQIRAAPANVEKLVFQTAELDRRHAKAEKSRYWVRWEIEPGSASRRENARWIKQLRGYDAKGVETGGRDKLQRALNCSVQAESGNVKLLRGSWNNMLLTNLHGFPELPHDDLFDATSGAFNETIARGVALSG